MDKKTHTLKSSLQKPWMQMQPTLD